MYWRGVGADTIKHDILWLEVATVGVSAARHALIWAWLTSVQGVDEGGSGCISVPARHRRRYCQVRHSLA
jgi:hypothetical protein